MRPSTDRRPFLLAIMLVALGAIPGVLTACGKQAVDVGQASDPRASSSPSSSVAGSSPVLLEVVIGDAAPAPSPVAPPIAGERLARESASAEERQQDIELAPDTLTMPKAWTGPIVPGLSFADALGKARIARDAFGRLAQPATSAKEAIVKAWYAQAQALVAQASRMYAAAFHASDAPREGRIDAVAEAAELDMAMARSLDEAGLGAMPAAWRADPAVASTFEDIATGPTRRWRDEARVLARQCIEVARESGVQTEAARRCAGLRTGAPLGRVKYGADAGAGCACSPGDPLCSASLGGWCGGSGR
jgi:hypothetical protein